MLKFVHLVAASLCRIGVVSGKAIFGPPLDEYWKKKLQEEAAAKENQQGPNA